MTTDLENRFAFHPAGTPERRQAHEDVRHACLTLADFLVVIVPPGREQAVMITKIEEVMFWGNAGIARHPADEVPPGAPGDFIPAPEDGPNTDASTPQLP